MQVTHAPSASAFIYEEDGKQAYVTYETYEGCFDVRKTFVPEEMRGQGIAAQLVECAYNYAKLQGLKCTATCSYAMKWLERHPEYEGQPSPDYVPDSCAIGKHQSSESESK
ncbi:MAG: N-acetyltransferase [Candidatus Anaerobiospirillum pullicola]|uniref:N-acetyltransferase n=1 Tax=Candidatus Anaerobiospirillum pullicola TaxID=2838451 RepID=A0A948TGT9_9GAMM|nr:N-acetyltransferase [Candidatus Anaerobiospirillum pullicola]